uniref:Apple domain-containing protein n=1 Tax=viral metagenome TaxID=1070528 RepID=A0A6C0IVR7_9ZZZZ
MFINIFILLTFVFNCYAYNYTKQNYLIYTNTFLNISNKLPLVINYTNINDCISGCNINDKCKSFNYYFNNKTNNYICQYLYKKYTQNPLQFNNNSNYYIKLEKNNSNSGDIIILVLFLTFLFVSCLFIHYKLKKKKFILTSQYQSI